MSLLYSQAIDVDYTYQFTKKLETCELPTTY